MKDHTTTPTAELLAEWGKFTAIAKHPNYAHDWNFDKPTFEAKIAAIAAELDRRCSYFGLCILPNGQFRLQEAILAIDLRDLLTWLIQKGGNG